MISVFIGLSVLLIIFSVLCMCLCWPIVELTAHRGYDGVCDFFCWLFDVSADAAFAGSTILVVSLLLESTP